jgi:hypothetical protein
MTELYLIQGGRDLGDADRPAALAAIPFLPLMDRLAAAQFAARAEKEAENAAALVTPAAAILAKDKSELVSMLAAWGPGEAAATRDAFRAAIAGVLVQLAVLRAAESRLLIAATAAAQSTGPGPIPVHIP